jgi:hypothetical protein
MAEQGKTERRSQVSRIIMSLYASSADYERRLSEDCVQEPEPSVPDEPPAEDPLGASARLSRLESLVR